MKHSFYLPALAAGLLLAACTAPQLVPMTGGEIRSELVGQTFRYEGYERSAFLFSGSLDIRENGTLEFRTDTNEAEAGTWRIADDKVCTTIKVLRSGAEHCVAILRLDADSFQTSDGYLLEKI